MKLLALMVGLGVVCFGAVRATAQDAEKGYWRAWNKTANSVTGDVAFSETKVSINFANFTYAQIRTLKADEVAAVFEGADAASGSGDLLRVDIPGDKKFVRKNTLCGAEPVEWLVTFVSGKTLQVAMFSGASIPPLTVEAMASGTRLCGTYSYQR